jgi:hypothetical protein
MARPYATVAAARGRPKRATTGLTWTFRLRPALKFHDGELVLAPSAPILTPPRKPESTHHAGNDTPAAFDRNAWPRSIGIPGRNRRNPHR